MTEESRGEVVEQLEGAVVRVPDHVVYRSFESETVLLNLRSGQYHGLNPTGGRMLEVLREAGTLAQAATILAAELEHPREAVLVDLLELCTRMLERGLIVVDEPGSS